MRPPRFFERRLTRCRHNLNKWQGSLDWFPPHPHMGCGWMWVWVLMWVWVWVWLWLWLWVFGYKCGCVGGCVGCLFVCLCVCVFVCVGGGGGVSLCVYVCVGVGRNMWVSSSIGKSSTQPILAGFSPIDFWGPKTLECTAWINILNSLEYYNFIIWYIIWLGLARTVYTHRMYGDFPAKHTVYTPYIPIKVWFWPTLHMISSYDEGKHHIMPRTLVIGHNMRTLLHWPPV